MQERFHYMSPGGFENMFIKVGCSETKERLKVEVTEESLDGMWGTVPSVEMWLSPHSEKPVGSEVGGQDPCPWIGFPLGNQALIVHRLL